MKDQLTLHHRLYMGPGLQGLKPWPLLMARKLMKSFFQNSTYEEFYGLGRTREPLYFGPRLPKMGKSCQNRV